MLLPLFLSFLILHWVWSYLCLGSSASFSIDLLRFHGLRIFLDLLTFFAFLFGIGIDVGIRFGGFFLAIIYLGVIFIGAPLCCILRATLDVGFMCLSFLFASFFLVGSSSTGFFLVLISSALLLRFLIS